MALLMAEEKSPFKTPTTEMHLVHNTQLLIIRQALSAVMHECMHLAFAR